MQTKFAKIGALALGVTFALSLSVNTAGAVTVAELQAQINALMAQLASLQGTATVSANFTTDLTVGSTGPQVVALQQMLVAQGHLVMPAGVAYGYFGSLTKAAVMKWQAANGISATGYFGPISRAKANASGGATGVVPGTTIGGGTTVGGTITTPGVEGTLNVTETAVGTVDEISEGESKVDVLGLELEAVSSDIRVERIEVQLGTDEDIYEDVLSRIYVMDGNTVLASKELSSSTVVENSAGTLVVTLSGMNFVVKKGTEENITIAFDAQSTIDAADEDGDSWTITIPVDGVRGVDGAGLNQYGPDSAISEAFTVEALAGGELSVTEASNNPDATSIEIDEDNTTEDVTMLVFELEAEEQDITVEDLSVFLTVSSGTPAQTFSSVSLYRGTTLIDTETVSAATTTFSNIDLEIEADDTETFTIKADIHDVSSTLAAGTTGSVRVNGYGVVAEDEEGDDVTTSGTATGETMTFRVIGAAPDLNSITESVTTSDSAPDLGTFVFKFDVTAFGDDVYLSATSTSGDTNAIVYTATGGTTASSTLSCSTCEETGDAFEVAEGETNEFTLTVIVSGNAAFADVEVTGVKWGTSAAASTENTTTVSDWESDSVYLSNN